MKTTAMHHLKRNVTVLFVLAVTCAAMAGCSSESPTAAAGKNDSPEIQKQREDKKGGE